MYCPKALRQSLENAKYNDKTVRRKMCVRNNGTFATCLVGYWRTSSECDKCAFNR